MPQTYTCDDSLRARIERNLAGFAVHPRDNADATAAAVAITVVEAGHGAAMRSLPAHEIWQNSAALLLTRRSSKLKDHPGQWALPGGRIDGEETPEQAALREMREEVNFSVTATDIIGRLDDYETRSGFVITPIVVWGGRAESASPNPVEVDSIHRIPLGEFLRPDAPILNDDPGPETEANERTTASSQPSVSANPVLRMPVGDTWIAAPTAAFLYQFAEVCLLGRHTRVAHFDQPRFAWR